MMTARKRVRLLPVQQLSVRHPVDHSSSDSSSRHSSSDHSSPDLPSTSVGPSRKRRGSPMTSEPALPLVSGALSPVRADLIPPPKRVRDIGYLADAEDDPRETRVERVVHPAMPEDILEPAQEGAAEVTYETLGDLVQRIGGVESAVIALTKRVAELERDNQRLSGTASVESQRFDRLRRGMSCENGGNENGGNRGNGNGDNGGNRNEDNGNHGMNYGGFMPMARECTFQDFLKCKPHAFSGTEGVVRLTRWSAENKRRMESNPRDNRGQQPPIKRQNTTRQNVARAYRVRNNKRKGKDCPKLRNQNCGNQTRNKTGGNEVTTKAYAIGGGGTNPDSNVVT
nr:hypothetical protein [Tanacetum cinerariifolium]